jgi:hypothetical protein
MLCLGGSFSTFFHPEGVLWPTLEAIDKVFPIGLLIDVFLKLEDLSKGFHDHSGRILDGCIMAIDGFGVQTRQPFDNKVEKPKDYWFCKAIIVLASCNINARFVSTSHATGGLRKTLPGA